MKNVSVTMSNSNRSREQPFRSALHRPLGEALQTGGSALYPAPLFFFSHSIIPATEALHRQLISLGQLTQLFITCGSFVTAFTSRLVSIINITGNGSLLLRDNLNIFIKQAWINIWFDLDIVELINWKNVDKVRILFFVKRLKHHPGNRIVVSRVCVTTY